MTVLDKEQRNKMRSCLPFGVFPEAMDDIKSVFDTCDALEEENRVLRRTMLAERDGLKVDAALLRSSVSDMLERLVGVEAERDAARRERDRFTRGVTCFSCKVAYTPEIADERCTYAHREEWPHEWVSQRVHDVTKKCCEHLATIEKCRAVILELINLEEMKRIVAQYRPGDVESELIQQYRRILASLDDAK